jgi:N-acetylneuraminate synthase
MSYIDYRRRIEFKWPDYVEICEHCSKLGIDWFASCWDEESVDFIEQFDPPCHKVASASLTDLKLMRKIGATGRPVMLSTGMSTMDQIADAVGALATDKLLIAHSTSSYPCPIEALNLRMLHTLERAYPECPIGYSGHETGLVPTWAAVTLGATFVERHITLDRAMWGSDQAASVEIGGLKRLVDAIRDIEMALGDGIKRIHESELPSIRRLRGASYVESLAG